jgi:FixJ family two-component response regulator
LLDVNLKGVSGIEVRQTLMRQRVSLPIIFMTASHSQIMRRQAWEVGCVAYLAKPFSAKSLVTAIQIAAQQHEQTSEQ